MIIEVERSGTPEGLKEALDSVQREKDVRGLLILACERNRFTAQDTDKILHDAHHPLFGGIFPGIIYGAEKLDKGIIVAGLRKQPLIQTISNLSNYEVDYEEQIPTTIYDDCSRKTMFVFVDCTARRIDSLLGSLFNLCGLECNYIGGGAGSLRLEMMPCLFTNEGLLEDSAVLALVDVPSGIGVAHGWESLSGPFTVTESEGNVVTTLDWLPAFDVYKEVVEEHSGRSFEDEDFYDLSKFYPFCISKLDAEGVVRDPVSRKPNGSLVCVGEVPQESLLDIMTGSPEAMVRAASMAREAASACYPGPRNDTVTLFMDCISRVLCLENDFGRELDAVRANGAPLIGALTIGEVANSGRDYLEFYNKTAVVGILEGR